MFFLRKACLEADQLKCERKHRISLSYSKNIFVNKNIIMHVIKRNLRRLYQPWKERCLKFRASFSGSSKLSTQQDTAENRRLKWKYGHSVALQVQLQVSFLCFFAILMAYPKQHCIIISIISGNPFECLSLSLERRNSQLSEFQKEFCSQAENSLPSVLSSSSWAWNEKSLLFLMSRELDSDYDGECVLFWSLWVFLFSSFKSRRSWMLFVYERMNVTLAQLEFATLFFALLSYVRDEIYQLWCNQLIVSVS